MTSISEVLATAEKTANAIAAHEGAVMQMFESKQPFATDTVGANLQADLAEIQRYILSLSKSCLNQLVDFNEALGHMNTEISEASGMMEGVKKKVGSQLVELLMVSRNDDSTETNKETVIPGSFIGFPNDPWDVNMQALDSVGHSVEEVSREDAVLAPLLTKIPPGSPMPSFWSTQRDYFSPAVPLMPTASEDTYVTSFSNFYGFDPVPGFVRAQQAAGLVPPPLSSNPATQ